MKPQATAMIVVFSAIITSTTADAGDFNFGDAVRKVQKINRAVNGPQFGGGNPQFGGGIPGYVKPLPSPGYGKPEYCPPPVHKPICKPQPPVSHCPPPVHAPPINRPPVKCYIMKLMNHTGADVFYNLDNSDEYTQMPIDDAQLIKSHSQQPHRIRYHNGQEVVEFELDPSATYAFEWQGETLVLLEIQA